MMVLAVATAGLAGAVSAAQRDPNIIIILTDDQGYADVGAYGAKGFQTPHLDRLAREGIRFTDFHVAQPVCSASRAACRTFAASTPEMVNTRARSSGSSRSNTSRVTTGLPASSAAASL